MRGLLFTLLPDDALILVIVVVAIGLMIGIFSRRVAFWYLGMVILYVLLSPFIDSLFEILPLWLVLLILGFFILSISRLILNLLFGRRATDTFVGLLMWNLFALPFRFLGHLLRMRR
jgi:hypothetical protein